MPLSNDPEKRARQLANLGRGGPAPAKGNQLAVKHGVYARVTEAELDEKTRVIFDAIAADAPARTNDGGLPAAHALTVRLLAEVMVLRERARAETIAHGLEIASGPHKGKLRGVADYGLRLNAQARELANDLGMTPRSGAALGLEVARTRRTLEDEVVEGLRRGSSTA